MMKHLHIELAGTTSSVKWPVLCRDKCRVIGMRVVASTAQTGASSVTVGENGATHSIYTADLYPGSETLAALSPIEAAFTDSVTDDEAATIFGPDKPLEIDVNLAVAGQISVVIELDPFLINTI